MCILREKDFSIDARARKQGYALQEAGAAVTLLGVGDRVPANLSSSQLDVQLVPRPAPARVQLPRLGREDVWWPLRVAVNLTFTQARARQTQRKRAWMFPYEDALLAAALELRPDVVHAHNIQTLGVAIRLKQQTGAMVIYDCRDMYTEVDYLDSQERKRLLKWESGFLRKVDAVITVSDALADAIVQRHGVTRPVPIYNGPIEVMSDTTPAHEPIRLFFQGAFMEHRNLIALVDAMESLKSRATLTLQGFDGIEEALRERVGSQGLTDVVRFIPPVGPLHVVRSASEYDVGIVCHKGTNLNMRSAVPNKLMDYLGAGLAVAASDLPGHRSVLDGTGAGLFLDPSSAESIAASLMDLLKQPARITEMKHAALATARTYEWSVQAERMIGVYKSVLRRSERRQGGWS